MKKISFNDYIPEELADNESCRLITTEQYKEYQLLKKKLDIALETLGQISLHSDDKVDAIQCAKTICEIEEIKE